MLHVVDTELPVDRAPGQCAADLIRMREEMRCPGDVAGHHLMTEHEAHRATELTIEERDVLFVERMTAPLLAKQDAEGSDRGLTAARRRRHAR